MNTQTAEPVYPIYAVYAKWMQYDSERGWFSNYTKFRKMYKEEQTPEQLEEFKTKWWDEYKKKFKEIQDVFVTMTFVEKETWCLTWFQHETFDIGQTDEQAVQSFEDYVSRKVAAGIVDGLMGADERYRWWSGVESYKGIPCRCKHSKEAGVLRIAH